MADKNYQVVVAIDFDISSCGYAYSFMDDKKIIFGSIFGDAINYRVPVEIILSNNYDILAFGYDCKYFLKEKGLNSGYYFKGIIEKLYAKINTIKAYNNEKSFSLIIILQKVLEQIKELALKHIRKKTIKESNIRWIITASPIWNEY